MPTLAWPTSKHKLGDGLWAQALSRVTDADRELIDHLLTGALDT
jgi:hypothetical protein